MSRGPRRPAGILINSTLNKWSDRYGVDAVRQAITLWFEYEDQLAEMVRESSEVFDESLRPPEKLSDEEEATVEEVITEEAVEESGDT